MNKAEIIDQLSDRLDMSKAEAGRCFEETFQIIKDDVTRGNRVAIPGFGTFDKRDRSAREGRNPQTGATIQIAATSVPGFKAAKDFKDQVAGK